MQTFPTYRKKGQLIVKFTSQKEGTIVRSNDRRPVGYCINFWIAADDKYWADLETVEDWLHTLEEPYKSKALEKSRDSRNHKASNLASAIMNGFAWRGEKAWKSIYSHPNNPEKWEPLAAEPASNENNQPQTNTNMTKLPTDFYIKTPTASIFNDCVEQLVKLGYNKQSLPDNISVASSRFPNVQILGYNPTLAWNERDEEGCKRYTEIEVTIPQLFAIKAEKKELVIKPQGNLTHQLIVTETGISDEEEQETATFAEFEALVKEVEEYKAAPKHNLPDKFWINVPTPKFSKEVQERLFSLGYFWPDGQSDIRSLPSKELDIGAFNKKEITHSSRVGYGTRNGLQEVSIPELFEEQKKVKFLENKFLDFDVTVDSNCVKIGCNSLSFELFNALVKQIKDFRATL